MWMNENFMLESPLAEELYWKHAAKMPIIDYHNHLSPKMIAENVKFKNITELWLGGDHYKWRQMRAFGIDEYYITGGAEPYEKFEKWAETLQYLLRNPLYHWSHLELKRYFGINKLLNPSTAKEIYDECNRKLENMPVRTLLEMMHVEVLCTTDDPIDSLEYHQAILKEQEEGKSSFKIRILPAWRPDKVVNIEKVDFASYIHKLEQAAHQSIASYDDLLAALDKRAAYFKANGARVSDHGLERVALAPYDKKEANRILLAAMRGEELTAVDMETYKASILMDLARLNYKMSWVQQFHIGAIRDNNRKLFRTLGPDIGCDSIADGDNAQALSNLLGTLDEESQLAKTILYNLNPKDNELLATMAYNFNDGSSVGKMQYGAAWWFLDQYDGMTKQINTLSSLCLLSKFIGMLTDSRSFISYTRHEYFRRLLCNIFAEDINRGLIPASEKDFVAKVIEDISYNNAKAYFEF